MDGELDLITENTIYRYFIAFTASILKGYYTACISPTGG